MISNRALLAVNALLLAGLVATALFWHPLPPAHERPLTQGTTLALPPGGEFTLQSAQGQLELKDFRGKLVLLYFGYMYCPDICPTALIGVTTALKTLSAEERAKVVTLFVSVDPRRDTVSLLADYVAFFHPDIIGATTSEAEIARIAQRYDVTYRVQSSDTNGNYSVDHSSLVYLLNAAGEIVTTFPHASAPETITAALRTQLLTAP